MVYKATAVIVVTTATGAICHTPWETQRRQIPNVPVKERTNDETSDCCKSPGASHTTNLPDPTLIEYTLPSPSVLRDTPHLPHLHSLLCRADRKYKRSVRAQAAMSDRS